MLTFGILHRCKAYYSRIDKSNYADIKFYLIILTSLIFRDINIYIPFLVIFENLVTSFSFMIAAVMLAVFPCMDYSSLYILKNVFTFTTTKIDFVSLHLILSQAIDFSFHKILLFSLFPASVLSFSSSYSITMLDIFEPLITCFVLH